MAKAKSFRCITEANAWRMRSLAGGNAQRMQGECLATPVLCSPLSPLVMARVCVRSCTLRCVSLGRLRTAMGFHKRRQSESRTNRPRDSPGRFTRGYPPVLTTLPKRGGTYAEACTIGTGFGIPVAQSPQKVRYSLHQNPENPGVLLREMRQSFVCNKMQVCEQDHA